MIVEHEISQLIIDEYTKILKSCLCSDVIIAGAGPSGLIASYYLAKTGLKVIIFERKGSIGGGIWGGGMMFNRIVVQDDAKPILDEIGVKTHRYGKYYVASACELATKLCTKAIDSGAEIFNFISVEDLAIQENKVTGVVVNWSAVEIAGLHVDPLTFESKVTIDATGHDAYLVNLLAKRGIKLLTPTGKIEGEKPMWAQRGEESVSYTHLTLPTKA